MDTAQKRLRSVADDIESLTKQNEMLETQRALLIAHLAARQIAGKDNDVVLDERNEVLKKLALEGELLLAYTVCEDKSVIEICTKDLTPLSQYPAGDQNNV